MSDLRPEGVKVKIGGQEYKFLLTINKIDEIQTRCNMPLSDAVELIAAAADGETEGKTLNVYRSVLSILMDVPEQEAGEKVTFADYRRVAWAMLAAYGISMPEPDDEEDEEEDEEPSPNLQTGR